MLELVWCTINGTLQEAEAIWALLKASSSVRPLSVMLRSKRTLTHQQGRIMFENQSKSLILQCCERSELRFTLKSHIYLNIESLINSFALFCREKSNSWIISDTAKWDIFCEFQTLWGRPTQDIQFLYLVTQNFCRLFPISIGKETFFLAFRVYRLQNLVKCILYRPSSMRMCAGFLPWCPQWGLCWPQCILCTGAIWGRSNDHFLLPDRILHQHIQHQPGHDKRCSIRPILELHSFRKYISVGHEMSCIQHFRHLPQSSLLKISYFAVCTTLYLMPKLAWTPCTLCSLRTSRKTSLVGIDA